MLECTAIIFLRAYLESELHAWKMQKLHWTDLSKSVPYTATLFVHIYTTVAQLTKCDVNMLLSTCVSFQFSVSME